MPRAGLSYQRVTGAAADLADQLGYDQLTLAAVAKHFGVAVPSLYKHITGLDQLREALAVESINALGRHLSDAVKDGPDSSLLALAAAYRDFARRHPGRYAATVRAADPSSFGAVTASNAVLATVLAVMDGYGIGGEEAIHATRAVRSALHGFIALEAAGGFGLPQDVESSFVRLVAMLEKGLAIWTKEVAPIEPAS